MEAFISVALLFVKFISANSLSTLVLKSCVSASHTLRETQLIHQRLEFHHPSCSVSVSSARFNMPHDDSNKCKEDGVKIQQHVMAPTLNYNTNPWMWSKCSRKYITEFLEYVILFSSALIETGN